MIPMFPFSLNNALKLFNGTNMDNSIDEEAIKDRISKAVMQSLSNKRNVRMNAIVVLEYDNDQKRTLVINESMNTNIVNNGNGNGQSIQIATTFPNNSFTPISSNDHTNTTNVLLSQQPIFPATMEGLQAILNLTSSSLNRSNIGDNVVHNSFSFIPMQRENNESNIKTEKRNVHNEGTYSSRKRKSEKPCRIPQEIVSETNGLDLTLGGRYEGEVKTEKYYPVHQTQSVPIWPCPVSIENRSMNIIQPMMLPRIKKAAQLLTHKKSSKVFNCNQCKLQFSSLNALCKHTFSDHRAFRCTFCSANFTQRSNLQRHSLKHVGFKPFICNVCTKSYYRKDHLVRHIEVSHPGSDPKSNITVKLSSSECLEYLEKMQTNKIAELSAAMESEQNNFLISIDKQSPISTENNNFPANEGSPVTLPQCDDAMSYQVSPPINDGCEYEDKLQIAFDETFDMVVAEKNLYGDKEDCARVATEVPISAE